MKILHTDTLPNGNTNSVLPVFPRTLIPHSCIMLTASSTRDASTNTHRSLLSRPSWSKPPLKRISVSQLTIIECIMETEILKPAALVIDFPKRYQHQCPQNLEQMPAEALGIDMEFSARFRRGSSNKIPSTMSVPL